MEFDDVYPGMYAVRKNWDPDIQFFSEADPRAELGH